MMQAYDFSGLRGPMSTDDHDAQSTADYQRLLAIATDIVGDSTAVEANGFDVRAWLDRWLNTPQSALGGRTPAQQLEVPDGFEAVRRLLGAISSGSYQ